MFEFFSKKFKKITHIGVDASTPAHLVDRIIFSNLIFLIGIGIDLLEALPNFKGGHWLLFGLNVIYLCSLITGFVLNSAHRYLASRLLILSVTIVGLSFTAAVTGPHLQNEHFLLVLGALAFSLLHPTERRYSFIFSIIAAVTYFILVNQTKPLFAVDAGPFTESDRYLNQIAYLLLYLLSLISISSAYDKAARVIDDQHKNLLEQARMTSAGTIARRVAHEINSPLTALELQLYQLRRLSKSASLDKETDERLRIVQQLSRRISVLVQGINYLSRSEPSEAPVLVPLGQVLDSVLEISSDRLREAKIALDIVLSDPQLRIRCRPIAFSQVILTLLNNAIDALEEQPSESRWIKIRSCPEPKSMEISITDGGSTPSQEIRDKMFTAFFTTKPLGRGTGLGLSVSRQVVREYGGDLFLDPMSPTTRLIIRVPVEESQ